MVAIVVGENAAKRAIAESSIAIGSGLDNRCM